MGNSKVTARIEETSLSAVPQPTSFLQPPGSRLDDSQPRAGKERLNQKPQVRIWCVYLDLAVWR